MAMAPHWPPPLGQSRAGGARAGDEEIVDTPSTQRRGGRHTSSGGTGEQCPGNSEPGRCDDSVSDADRFPSKGSRCQEGDETCLPVTSHKTNGQWDLAPRGTAVWGETGESSLML